MRRIALRGFVPPRFLNFVKHSSALYGTLGEDSCGRPMFKKPDKKPDPLADRMRKISAQPALEDDAYKPDRTLQNRNRAPRQLTFKQGTITMQGGERMDVVVKNLSDTGARIEYFRKVHLTEMVVLSEPTMRIKTRARVMWQTDGAAGLQFVAGW